MGLGVAKECVRRGMARVVILARNVDKLNAAKEQLEHIKQETKNTTTMIETVSVDISDYAALEKAATDLYGSNNNNNNNKEVVVEDDGHATYLFQCAGYAYPGYFMEIPISEFERQVKTNQLGSIYCVRAFLPFIQRGNICLTSSMVGLFGVFGYTAYAPTKFALRGFAEVLHVELACRPITIQVAYPPDMDTPGYQEENKTKPKECFYISAQGSMFKPDE
jgi:3-dehydrosphinganine reductase